MGSVGEGKDDENVAIIQKEMDQLTVAADKFLKLSSDSKNTETDTDAQDVKFDLAVKASRLLQTIRGPTDMVFAHFESVSITQPISDISEVFFFFLCSLKCVSC